MVRAFVINLDTDTERMAFMARQLDALGIPYERFAALRGESVPVKEYDAEAARSTGGHALIPGELGCAASHKRIYEQVLARGLPYALVLEDDVELPRDFAEIVEEEVARNRGQWEYLLFDYWEPGMPFLKRWFKSVGSTIHASWKNPFVLAWHVLYALAKVPYIVPLSIFEGIRNACKRMHPGPVVFYRPLFLAGAYLVSQEGARKLLSLSDPIIYTADALPNEARRRRGLAFRAYAPCIVRQEKARFGSSILHLPGSAT